MSHYIRLSHDPIFPCLRLKKLILCFRVGAGIKITKNLAKNNPVKCRDYARPNWLYLPRMVRVRFYFPLRVVTGIFLTKLLSLHYITLTVAPENNLGTHNLCTYWDSKTIGLE